MSDRRAVCRSKSNCQSERDITLGCCASGTLRGLGGIFVINAKLHASPPLAAAGSVACQNEIDPRRPLLLARWTMWPRSHPPSLVATYLFRVGRASLQAPLTKGVLIDLTQIKGSAVAAERNFPSPKTDRRKLSRGISLRFRGRPCCQSRGCFNQFFLRVDAKFREQAIPLLAHLIFGTAD
jgi:hypothetical protein